MRDKLFVATALLPSMVVAWYLFWELPFEKAGEPILPVSGFFMVILLGMAVGTWRALTRKRD